MKMIPNMTEKEKPINIAITDLVIILFLLTGKKSYGFTFFNSGIFLWGLV